MSKRAFDKVEAGLESAREYLDGTADKRRYRVHVPEKADVKDKEPDVESKARGR
jgi:putative transcriptional regulator